jgi:cutinase
VPGVRAGVIDVVNRIKSQSAACPNQKFALIGYSQGASLMHNAAPKIPADLYPKIVALVMFGDPELRKGATGMKFPGDLPTKLLENCAENDMVRHIAHLLSGNEYNSFCY